MDSFEELGLAPEVIEALSAEGLERPTAFQQGAIPVIRRGNNLVGRAGPGSGCQVAYVAALLDRVEADGEATRVVILTPTPEAARRGAELAARLAGHTGHAVAALGSPWALPERAEVLFATPDDLMDAVRSSRIKLDAVEALVLDGGGATTGLGALPSVEAILEVIPPEAQRVVLALPLGTELKALVEGHVRKAVHLPPRPVDDTEEPEGPARGEVAYVVTGEDRSDTLVSVVDRLFGEGVHHVLVFFGSEDRAADGGDFLTLHGYMAGSPGDASVPVWLGVDELEARDALSEGVDLSLVATVSCDVPADPDALDRRHGIGTSPTCLVLARELPHLKDTARRAGYGVRADPAALPAPARGRIEAARARVVQALEERDLLPDLLLLQPLFERWAPAEVAAALSSLLRDTAVSASGRAAVSTHAPSAAASVPSWARLFISVGSKDGVGPGDLVGAISGEAGVTGSQVGKIEIRETFSLVDVEQPVAERVIKALNGTSLRGRAARVDYDRGSRSGGRTGGDRGGRPQRGGRGPAGSGHRRPRTGGKRPD